MIILTIVATTTCSGVVGSGTTAGSPFHVTLLPLASPPKPHRDAWNQRPPRHDDGDKAGDDVNKREDPPTQVSPLSKCSANCLLTPNTQPRGSAWRCTRRKLVPPLLPSPPSNLPPGARAVRAAEDRDRARSKPSERGHSNPPTSPGDFDKDPPSCRRSRLCRTRRANHLSHTRLPVLENAPPVLSQDVVHAVLEAREPNRHLRVA